MGSDAKNIEETQRRTWYRMLNWTVHAELARRHFEQVAKKAKDEGYFEFLYVTQDENERQLQFFAGAHPVGTMQSVWDPSGRLRRQRLYVEKGAALVMSQSIRGEVAIFLFPYESEKHSRREKLIVWDVFEDPAQVTESVLRRVTKDFFTYIRVSSLYFTPSLADRLRIGWLLFRSRRFDEEPGMLRFIFKHPLVLLIGLLGSIASILSLAHALWK